VGVGNDVGGVAHLRRWGLFFVSYPPLTRWANVCRTSGAQDSRDGKKAGPSHRSQRGASGFGPAEASGMQTTQMTAEGADGHAARLKPCPDEEHQAEACHYVTRKQIPHTARKRRDRVRSRRSVRDANNADDSGGGGRPRGTVRLKPPLRNEKAGPSPRSQRARAGSG